MDKSVVALAVLWVLAVAIGLVLRKAMRINSRGLANSDEALEGMRKRLAMDEEIIAQNSRLVDQGDETIALLKAIKDNLDNRSIKN